MARTYSFLVFTVVVGLLTAFPTAQVPSSNYANFEGSQTNPIRLSQDGTRLFAVNTAAGTLSVFDVSDALTPTLITQIPVGLEPVSVNPRSNDEAWVVNQASDSVSIVSVSRGIVTATLSAKDEPMDVVFAGANQAFVSLSRSNQIAIFDATTGAFRTTLPVFGGNPRALAVSPDGNTVYAAFAISGNGTTVIPAAISPRQPPPLNTALPEPPRVASIVRADNPLWSWFIRYTLPDNDVAVIDAQSLAVSRYYSGVGTINFGLAVHPLSGDIFVTNTEARNLVRFEPNVRGHFVDNRITKIEVASDTVMPVDLNPGIDYTVLPNPAARATAIAQPTAIAIDPRGAFMYIASFGTDRIVAVDTNGRILTRIELAPASGAGSNVDPRNKRGPRGLALSPMMNALYVLNRISNTVSVIDTARRSVARELAVGYDPTPPIIREGRGFLYDAKLSGNGTASCASCHIDADKDHLAWDLGNRSGEMQTVIQDSRVHLMHPMKGPMTTQTLRGLVDLAPFHWRGDRANFPAFNPAFDSLMGGTQLSSTDMLTYTGFINTVRMQPNPFQNFDRTLRTSLAGGNPVQGKDVFVNAPLMLPGPPFGGSTCNSCHMANPGPGTNRFIHPMVSGVRNLEQPLKVPQLRNIYQKLAFNKNAAENIDGFGLDHDGHIGGLAEFFAAGSFANYSDTQKRDLGSFVMSLDTGTAPAVGLTQTLTAANVSSTMADAVWDLLEGQVAAGNSELIGHGTINGTRSGLYYDSASSRYIVDTNSGTPLSRTDLIELIKEGDIITVMGVYPGTAWATFVGRAMNGVR